MYLNELALLSLCLSLLASSGGLIALLVLFVLLFLFLFLFLLLLHRPLCEQLIHRIDRTVLFDINHLRGGPSWSLGLLSHRRCATLLDIGHCRAQLAARSDSCAEGRMKTLAQHSRRPATLRAQRCTSSESRGRGLGFFFRERAVCCLVSQRLRLRTPHVPPRPFASRAPPCPSLHIVAHRCGVFCASLACICSP